MEKTKDCTACVHFLRHYIIKNGRFHPINGHCVCKIPGGRFRKTDKICECYEERDLAAEKDERKRSATEWLEFIAKRVDELTQILADCEAKV